MSYDKDFARDHLVMRLRCSRCGHLLTMSYEAVSEAHLERREEVVTGGCKVEFPITVHPCRHCWQEASAPLLALKTALGSVEAFKS